MGAVIREMMDPRTTLSECNVAIVKHTYTPTGGAEQELLRYLLPRARSVVYVSHPFPDATGVSLNTSISFFEHGRLSGKVMAPLIRGPAPVYWAKDVLSTLWYLGRSKRKFQIYVGVDNLNAFSGLILRRLGIAGQVIFYVIDYAPQRFRSRLGRFLYRILDKHCCYGSDIVWNVSAAMEEARVEAGVHPNRCSKQLEVPLGSRYSEIRRLPLEDVDVKLMVFLGSLTPEQGLNLVIEAMPRLRALIPGIRLRVIGEGREAASLKRLATEKDVADAVEFLGYIEDDSEVARLVSECAVGVAPYVRTGQTFKWYADPGKVKIYLAAGLPVVISKVPRVAALIEERKAGVAIEPSVGNVVEALAWVLTSPERMRQLRANASSLGREFDWETVYDRAFEQTFRHWETADGA